jgi:beta-xylosidase
MYYMTGTGGMLWKSKDLKLWEGPFHVAKTDSGSWMGPKPMIWAAELHPYKGKYYYFATFTNQAVKIDTVQGNVIERRASHVLVSDNPDGPYVPMKDSTYLPADKPTLDGTFWVDKDGKPYMVYCYEWLQALDGKWLMSVHSHKDVNGRYIRTPRLFEVDFSGDKLVVGKPYIP